MDQQQKRVEDRAWQKAMERAGLPGHIQHDPIEIQRREESERGTRLQARNARNDLNYSLQFREKLPEKWREGTRTTLREIAQDSRSVAEGFLAFYGIEARSEEELLELHDRARDRQTRPQDPEIER